MVDFIIDNTSKTAGSRNRNSASAAGKGSISETTYGIAPLSAVMYGDGSWTLTMTLSTADNKVSGTATVSLDSGRTLDFAVKGVFKSNTGLSTLILTGIDASKGSNLQVRMDQGAVTLIKGKISGQLINAAL
jgi:hypothetical protein